MKFLIPPSDDKPATPLVRKCKRGVAQKITSSAQVIERNFTSIMLLLLVGPCRYRFILKKTNKLSLHPPINTISTPPLPLQNKSTNESGLNDLSFTYLFSKCLTVVYSNNNVCCNCKTKFFFQEIYLQNAFLKKLRYFFPIVNQENKNITFCSW